MLLLAIAAGRVTCNKRSPACTWNHSYYTAIRNVPSPKTRREGRDLSRTTLIQEAVKVLEQVIPGARVE